MAVWEKEIQVAYEKLHVSFSHIIVLFIYPNIIFAHGKKSEIEPSLIYKHAHCP